MIQAFQFPNTLAPFPSAAPASNKYSKPHHFGWVISAEKGQQLKRMGGLISNSIARHLFMRLPGKTLSFSHRRTPFTYPDSQPNDDEGILR